MVRTPMSPILIPQMEGGGSLRRVRHVGRWRSSQPARPIALPAPPCPTKTSLPRAETSVPLSRTGRQLSRGFYFSFSIPVALPGPLSEPWVMYGLFLQHSVFLPPGFSYRHLPAPPCSPPTSNRFDINSD